MESLDRLINRLLPLAQFVEYYLLPPPSYEDVLREEVAIGAASYVSSRGRPTAREPLLPLPPITRKEVRRLIAQATSDEKNAAADVQDAAVREQQAWRDVDDLLIEDGDGAEQAPPLGDTDLPRVGRQKTILPLAQQDVEPSSATAPQVSLPAARRSGRKTGPPSLLGFPPVPPGRP